MAKKFRSVVKSRKNTSGRKSKAAASGAKQRKLAKDRLSGKKIKSAVKKVSKPKVKDPNLKRGNQFPVKPGGLEAKTARLLPDTYLTRKGLTLRKLLRNTPRLFVNNADYVDILSLKKVKSKTGLPAIVGKVITNDPNYPGYTQTVRHVHIIGMDRRDSDGKPDFDKPVNKHRKVMVQCSCESYTFHGFEYANTAHGAARIIYGNGDPPTFTNPGLLYGCCKHLYRVGLEVVRKNQ